MFNTVNPPARENRLVELARQDLSNAQNNLARARMAARRADVNAQWGQSGKTLAEIIAGYEKWEREALESVAQAKALYSRP